MNAAIVNVVQGTDEWHSFRLAHFGASEAAAMLGLSPKITRAQLMTAKHTGLAREFGEWLQRNVLDKGHASEAGARPIIERRLGVELYPATYADGRLSASCDGIDLLGEVAFEHKQWNDALAEFVSATGEPPDEHLPQCQQVLMLTGAARLLFVVSDGTAERMVVAEVLPDPAWFERLRAGWEQFERDLVDYVPPDNAEAKPTGQAPQTLPALRIEVQGAVTASNLSEFRETALAAIRGVNRELTTDQHFADAELAVKWCGEVESRLAAAKQHALSQTASIDALFKAIDDIGAEARRVRLDLEKLVARRKDELRNAAVSAARRALDEHIAGLNAEIAPMALRPVVADFAGAIKGRRSLDSINAALDATLVAAQINADAQAKAIRGNLAAFKAQADGFEHLFADLSTLVHKAPDDFAALVAARITTHKAAEAARESKRQAEEAARIEAQSKADAHASAPIVAQSSAVPVLSDKATADANARAFVASATEEPATLKLGDINARIAPLKIDAAGMAELGIRHARQEGAAKLYREGDYRALLRAINARVRELMTVTA